MPNAPPSTDVARANASRMAERGARAAIMAMVVSALLGAV
jgi:hypothetical protein